jgi:phosphomannomutase / phosphoglucomutase
MIETRDYATGEGSYRTLDLVPDYVDEVAKQFVLPRKVKVVVDSGNGTAGPVIERILSRLNVEFVSMFGEMDGSFPNHHPDPTVPANLRMLADKVRETGAELGIGFDGDSDRIGAVDENGDPVFGDMLMLIFAREILTRKPGATFIGEVKCSQIMYDELERLGGRPIMYKTGHSLIKAKMKEEHAELAGEMSGHMFFADRYFGFDDALYSACRLIEIVANTGLPLSRQLDGLPKTVCTPELRLETTDEAKFDVVARVAAHFRQTRKIVDVDGARVIFPHGWGLVPRLQHATRPRHALRSGDPGAARRLSPRSRRGVGARNRRPTRRNPLNETEPASVVGSRLYTAIGGGILRANSTSDTFNFPYRGRNSH